MGTVRLLARVEIRRRWRSTVVLALLLGAVGALVLAAAAGARRSDSALDRFNAFSRSSSTEISIGTATPAQLRAFRRAPGVAAIALLHGYSLSAVAYPNLSIAAPDDTAMGRVLDRARLIKGRFGNPSAPDEITIGESLASQLHLRIGSHLDTQSYTPRQLKVGFSGGDAGPPQGPKVRLLVVGIVRRPLDLGVRAAGGGVVLLTPAFNATYKGRVGIYTDVLRVRTVRGAADVQRVVTAARKLWGTQQTFDVQGLGIETEGARNAIDVLTLALWMLAGMTMVAGAVAIGIVLSRDIAHVAEDQPALRALGASRGQRTAAIITRALAIAAGGALLAGLGAILASPRFPVGIARRADPDVGLHADWVVLGVGFVLVAVVVIAVALLAAWRVTRAPSADRSARYRRRTSPIVEAAARTGMPPAATNGLRMALQSGSGESAVPIRSAYAGAVFGIAGVAAALVFAASLTHLVATPQLAGWAWDLKAEVPTSAAPNVKCADQTNFGLVRAPGIEAAAAACIENIEIDGRPLSAWGFESLRGRIAPEVVSGRAPRDANEVALGALTLQKVHRHIGETVTARGEAGTRKFRIVGSVAFPSLTEAEPLADGAWMTVPGIRPLITKGENETHFLLLKFSAGADRAPVARKLVTLSRAAHAAGAEMNVGGPTTPVEIKRLQQVNGLPAILAALLTTLAAVAVGHALVTSVRRRRRELALLKTIGFNHRQLGATVAWQASVLATVGLVIGLPIGLLAGRAAWHVAANGLGVSTGTTVPTTALILTALGSLVFVNLIAYFPARTAARTPPAIALRSE